MKNNFRSKVFKRAYAIASETGCRFSEALTESWRVYNLLKAMKTKAVTFTYLKQDNTERIATGILKPITRKSTKNVSLTSISYFDVDAQGYRRFNAGRLIDIAA
jgi:hypothetical protein